MRKIEIGKEYIHFKGMIVKVICVLRILKLWKKWLYISI
jgi:hypothetical protein